MPDMAVMSLVAAVAPRTDKFIRNGLNVFEDEFFILFQGRIYRRFR